MKAIYAGTATAVPISNIKQYLFSCNRKAWEKEFYIPVTSFADVQVYIQFSTVKPTAFTVQLIDLCDTTSASVDSGSISYIIGKDPNNNYYGVFQFSDIEAPSLFALAVDVTISGIAQRYFTQGYQIETCNDLLKVEACFPRNNNEFGFDYNGIYFGLTTNAPDSLGNTILRYQHYAYLRQAKVCELQPKAIFNSNLFRNFKTTLDRQFEVQSDVVPAWYKDYILAIYLRGYIQVNGIIYQVTDLSFEGIDDDDYSWIPNAKCRIETRYYFGCDNSPCTACCSPTDVSATTGGEDEEDGLIDFDDSPIVDSDDEGIYTGPTD